ncbi:MAG: serine--tRNA ligase [Nanoarchaeota archaeon]|mgnify:CR=1 FL=1
MLDIKFLKDHKEEMIENLKKRNRADKTKEVDDALKQYEESLQLKYQAEGLRHRRNVVSEEINQLKKQKKDATNKIKEIKNIPGKIQQIEGKQSQLQEKVQKILADLPNILHPSVPEGKDANDNVVIKTWGKKRTVNFELQNHAELLEKANLADFETARKASGQGFNYLLGEMALLDLALQRYGLDILLKNGFTPVIPPMLLRYETLAGVLNGLKDFEEVVYKIEKEDAYLIGTAEHSLVALFQDKTIKEKNFPVKICAVTPCFRKEIGAHGVDTKGLFRMHQFNKVEQVVLAKPEDSFKMLEQIQAITEKFFQSLEIPYRVVEICSGDIGAKTAKQYDIEAWFPRQNMYREVTSASNCTDYQARSLNIKYEDSSGEKKYVHILNNTMVATSRAMVAILENFQQEDGSIELPKVLQPYMNGLKTICR